jgi:tRNA U34 2-thiouridine synthase MnmA/TrmU
MKALALFSGGLDSLLAIKLIQEAGIEVEPIHFILPFFDWEAEAALRSNLQDLADQLGARVRFERLGEDYLRMLENPKYGYGKAMNPCLDCHIFFLNRAKEMMQELGASFLVTGEVVGQRPKSQNEGAFPKIDQETGFTGLIVRPLSIGLLPRTIPEEKGWVNLDHCPSIQGRQRKVQIDLAKKYGLRYQAPGGGCLFTNKEFGQKVADVIHHDHHLSLESMVLLNTGRHFRSPSGWKLIIGRDERDNRKIIHYFFSHRHGEPLTLSHADIVTGPLAIGLGTPNDEDLEWAARLIARYSDLTQGSVGNIDFLISDPVHRTRKRQLITINADKAIDLTPYRIC